MKVASPIKMLSLALIVGLFLTACGKDNDVDNYAACSATLTSEYNTITQEKINLSDRNAVVRRKAQLEAFRAKYKGIVCRAELTRMGDRTTQLIIIDVNGWTDSLISSYDNYLRGL